MESVPKNAKTINLPISKTSKKINKKDKKFLVDVLNNNKAAVKTANVKTGIDFKSTVKKSYQNEIQMFLIYSSDLAVYRAGENFQIVKFSIKDSGLKKNYIFKTLNGQRIFSFDFQKIKQDKNSDKTAPKYYATNFKTFNNESFNSLVRRFIII